MADDGPLTDSEFQELLKRAQPSELEITSTIDMARLLFQEPGDEELFDEMEGK